MGFTGVIAVTLLFLAGPYRTLQKRWPKRWGPVMPVWAHSNLSLAAGVAVAVHLAVGAREFGPLAILTWIAASLFTIAMISGTFGLLLTTKPSRRRWWLKFHRTLTNVLYLTLVPHVLIKGFGGVTGIFLVVFLFLLWRYNTQILLKLKTINWPLHKASRSRS